MSTSRSPSGRATAGSSRHPSGRGLPPAGPDEPSDEELLACLDGRLDANARGVLAVRLAAAPLASLRLGAAAAALRSLGHFAAAIPPPRASRRRRGRSRRGDRPPWLEGRR